MFFLRTRRIGISNSIGWTDLSIILLLGLCCCQQPQKESSSSPSLLLRHATGFEVTPNTIEVIEPWPGAQRQVYPLPQNVQRVICTSTTHLHFLELLGLEDRLVGFPTTRYIYSEKIRKRVDDGEIRDIGPDGAINLELVLSLKPDLVIAFDAGNESGILQQIKEAGIPVMLNADYMEKTPLGRAEWLKFFGAIFDRERKADSVFHFIESNYIALRDQAAATAERPAIMTGVLLGETWFLPGGQNWLATFFEESGGKYVWGENQDRGWLELSFEAVYEQAGTASYWIGTATFSSREELLGADDRYHNFDPVSHDRVYNYDLRYRQNGGNDFFESAYARPDIVLADLIAILHPEVLPDHQPFYFGKLP